MEQSNYYRHLIPREKNHRGKPYNSITSTSSPRSGGPPYILSLNSNIHKYRMRKKCDQGKDNPGTNLKKRGQGNFLQEPTTKEKK